MGMFTTVLDKDGRGVQIYGGEDTCEMYRIGDTVNWYVNPHRYGNVHLLDGVYCGLYCGQGSEFKDAFVVIKDHVVVGVVDDDELPEGFPSREEEPGNRNEAVKEFLEEKYGVKPLPEVEYRALFTPEAMEKYNRLEANLVVEIEKFQASIAHLSLNDQFVQTILRFANDVLMPRDSIGRKLIQVKPLLVEAQAHAKAGEPKEEVHE